jgi:hypothetical protein
MPPNKCSRCGRPVDPAYHWRRTPDGSLLCCSCEEINAGALSRERRWWGVAAVAMAMFAIVNLGGSVSGCYHPRAAYDPWSGPSPFDPPSWTNSLPAGPVTNVQEAADA